MVSSRPFTYHAPSPICTVYSIAAADHPPSVPELETPPRLLLIPWPEQPRYLNAGDWLARYTARLLYSPSAPPLSLPALCRALGLPPSASPMNCILHPFFKIYFTCLFFEEGGSPRLIPFKLQGTVALEAVLSEIQT